MGGDRLSSGGRTDDDDSSLDQEFVQHQHEISNFYNEDALDSAVFEANQRHKLRVYNHVLKSYDDLKNRSEHLEEAKRKILSYKPGSWIDKASGTRLSDYNVPKMTSLLLIGPKGSGKSSLINKVSKLFENNMFVSERAQVSDIGDGTCFTHEYMIPRNSGTFCLYDTHGFSNESSKTMEIIEHWMINGVQHGELVLRDSDSLAMKRRIKCKARNYCNSTKSKMVNFVIFVVNGLPVLEAINSDDENKKLYTQMIKTIFNNPFLSFKDDKPIIVVTHGDLLLMNDRVKVRLYLGELLGFSPHKQIFDIPASENDQASELAITDMIRYCLEHADKNIPMKEHFTKRISKPYLSILLFMFMGITILSVLFSLYTPLYCNQVCAPPPSPPPAPPQPPPPPPPLAPLSDDDTPDSFDWNAIRHLWLGDD